MVRKIIRSSIILALIIFTTFLFSKEVSRLNHLRTENEMILQRIEKLNNENEDYKEKIESMKNEKRYLEKVVREELGMIKKGEKIYRFDNK